MCRAATALTGADGRVAAGLWAVRKLLVRRGGVGEGERNAVSAATVALSGPAGTTVSPSGQT
ncbi:hypothetical protein SFR_4082 [Streptomyces sp. FR-008]|nr:hypothetical protein SFR_4082 [Streptomyces sp. FR-008]